MANFIPEDKISEISHAADIVDIISETVLLKKAGKNYIGLCPFHSEKTPSFTVSPEKQMFYCFGCGEGGNVFKFIQKQNGFSFVESVKMLAGKYNIILPAANQSPQQKKRLGLRTRIFRANQKAMEFYHNRLMAEKSGDAARTYLEQRGISLEDVDRFQLGYAPADWELLKRFLLSKKITPQEMVEAGLIIPRKSRTGHYDRFRNRIIFPIVNISGYVVGFGGRVMDDSLPKYLNTPETPVFNKRRLLYGLNAARLKCRESGLVYLVEGYCDVLALYRYGIENAVATLGTALTSEHIRLIRGFARRAVLVYDSDAAGIKAARRSCHIFLKEKMDADIMVLPAGHDPDSFIRENGRRAFLNLASRAREMVRFLTDAALEKHGRSVNGRIRVMEAMKPILTSIDDPIARALHIKELAERLGIDEGAVRERVGRATVESGFQAAFSSRPDERSGLGSGAPRDAGPHAEDRGTRLERQIIAMMLQFPQMIPEIKKRNLLALFTNSRLKQVGDLVFSQITAPGAPRPGIDITRLTSDEKLQRLAAFLTVKEDVWDRKGCLKLLSQFETSRRRHDKSLLHKIKTAEKNNDRELLNKLLRDMKNQMRESQPSIRKN